MIYIFIEDYETFFGKKNIVSRSIVSIKLCSFRFFGGFVCFCFLKIKVSETAFQAILKPICHIL